ncbi:winged helix-turn-helix domain-containing protein [Mesorhizobium sp. VK22B]|uniref:Winged helix-turn-helix domain-containing protein n=1 Tax=Mesorhizobium captivum TaxID=3072319 RepID=A0ABU4Z183_9HYPH|nr:winged helix-turn-helix domain-containing protein [Mesorhizobium sp. VK22B]MDX8492949.1 winged helix-turn-helix domain-containing protein [Mesorhizobium sp. VK22B]
MNACPCCGFREGSGNPFQIVRTLRLTRHERAMFQVFAENFGTFLTGPQLVDAMYADDPTGGPDTAENSISVRMKVFREKLRKGGLDIDVRQGRGGGRRLVWAKTGRAARK